MISKICKQKIRLATETFRFVLSVLCGGSGMGINENTLGMSRYHRQESFTQKRSIKQALYQGMMNR